MADEDSPGGWGPSSDPGPWPLPGSRRRDETPATRSPVLRAGVSSPVSFRPVPSPPNLSSNDPAPTFRGRSPPRLEEPQAVERSDAHRGGRQERAAGDLPEEGPQASARARSSRTIPKRRRRSAPMPGPFPASSPSAAARTPAARAWCSARRATSSRSRTARSAAATTLADAPQPDEARRARARKLHDVLVLHRHAGGTRSSSAARRSSRRPSRRPTRIFKPRVIAICSTCPVGLIGDDVHAVAREMKEKLGINVFGFSARATRASASRPGTTSPTTSSSSTSSASRSGRSRGSSRSTCWASTTSAATRSSSKTSSSGAASPWCQPSAATPATRTWPAASRPTSTS